MFEDIPAYPGDPILSLNEDFQRDPRTNKVNLSIGIYFDENGVLPVMSAVREAEAAIVAQNTPRSYLPMAGMPQYREAAQELVFGTENPARMAGRIVTVQTVGGSGALKVGADFLKRHFADSQVWLSDPSWENHRVVFEAAGHTVNAYPYYDTATGGLLFSEMRDTIDAIPERSIVLLHACCHNPTGVDLTIEQWQELVTVLQRRNHIVFVDMAYQGFGDGLESDAACVRMLSSADVPLIVANSFSKNLSLYGERCGALSVVCKNATEAERVLGQLTATIRANYSNPPMHGARLIAEVLGDAGRRASWEGELSVMRDRIHEMRHAIHEELNGRVDEIMRKRYVAQVGMFTYTGLSIEQVEVLRVEHGIYLLRSGRMCVAGLNRGNVAFVASAIAAVAGSEVDR
ncbi:amino acid aminotransferase [Burkholderia ubonensis]|uniref:amino acid aminotransferase n=1 Tax=Burkholderia ubonensis TaxID=101571 RepID=UPI00016A374A|nr:amino acid aminotransferase [Burkholderia ubonensis]